MSTEPVNDQGSLNRRWALALLDGLIAGGLEQLVMSPGSRSTPVVMAAQLRPQITITVILDERSAAFFALGLARASGHPVALLCTSGSAPAHWLPAVIEASESRLPLVLLSADRPPELRGWGANQTIDQSRLFDPFTRAFHDPGPAFPGAEGLHMMQTLGRRVATVSQTPCPGPVHINLPFREPLVPAANAPVEVSEPPCGPATGALPLPAWQGGEPTPALAERLRAFMRGPGLICCGPERYPEEFAGTLWRCASQLDVPVLCDPLSNLRQGPATAARITRYDSFLRNARAAAALRPSWVLRIGRAPVSKTLGLWLQGIPTLLVDPGCGWSDPGHDALARVDIDPRTLCDWLAHEGDTTPTGWTDRWLDAEQYTGALATAHLADSPWCEPHLITSLFAALPAGDGLLSANSQPIRQIDTWSGAGAQPFTLFGNRGVSGIDGQLSTLAGLNAGGIPTTALLGDLSFLHDLGGLLLTERLDRPCIVLNNGGGRIFDHLPQHGLPGFERLWRTPQTVEPGALARAFGLEHRRVDDARQWHATLDEFSTLRHTLIEVRIDAARSQDVHHAFWAKIRETTQF